MLTSLFPEFKPVFPTNIKPSNCITKSAWAALTGREGQGPARWGGNWWLGPTSRMEALLCLLGVVHRSCLLRTTQINNQLRYPKCGTGQGLEGGAVSFQQAGRTWGLPPGLPSPLLPHGPQSAHRTVSSRLTCSRVIPASGGCSEVIFSFC